MAAVLYDPNSSFLHIQAKFSAEAIARALQDIASSSHPTSKQTVSEYVTMEILITSEIWPT